MTTLEELGLAGFGLNICGMVLRSVRGYFKDKADAINREALRKADAIVAQAHHDENSQRLIKLDSRLDTLNGTVAKHVIAIALHGQAIETIREKQKDE